MDEDHHPLDRRRQLLKYAGLTALSGLAGCAGRDGGGAGSPEAETDTPTESPTPTEPPTPTDTPTETPTATPTPGGAHPVPHPDDGEVPAEEADAEALNGIPRGTPAENKNGIGYQHEPKGDKRCGNCSQYVPDATDDGFGACIIVAGKIHPCDYCTLWVEYEGDDPVPCEERTE